MKKGSHQAHGEAEAVVVFEFASDEKDSCDDDASAEQLPRSDGPSFDEGFGNGGEEGDGRKGREGNGHVGEGDGPEEADPVCSLEQSQSEDGQQSAAGKTKERAVGSCQPDGHGKARNGDPPENE